MEPRSPWKLVSKKVLYKNRWVTIHEDRVITPTGVDGIYAYMESNDSVIIIACNDKGEVYLIRRYLYPQQTWRWGLPGGGGDREQPVEASKRELEEETGIQARTWDRLGETTINGGLMTERMVTYLARDLSFTGEKEHSDEMISRARFVPKNELTQMIQSGELDDGQALTALQLYSAWQAIQ
jgi:8-oxo-dGTP pyrophosphatase MutT (NUDIX family)